MTQADDAGALEIGGELSLDPFAYVAGAASRIVGLGGSGPLPNAEYVFHTIYVPVAEGPATFKIRFDRLMASHGELILRVHRLGDRPGADLVLANSTSVQLDRIAQNGTSIAVRFEGFQDVVYALYGGIIGNTDAAAEGLSIILDRPFDPARARATVVEARNTAFGSVGLRPTAHLGSTRKALLASPVCQIATRDQLAEPAAADWLGKLGGTAADPCARWSLAYIAQTLSVYGMLEAGARGLALRDRSPALLAEAVARGAAIIDAAAPGAGVEQPSHPGDDLAAATDADGERRLIVRSPADLTDLAADLVNFDFLWSLDLGLDGHAARDIAQFIQFAVGCLRPGGVAVHVVRFAFSGGDDGCFIKQQIDQLALGIIGAGHEIAQIRIGETDDILWDEASAPGSRVTRFGLLIRRARLIA